MNIIIYRYGNICEPDMITAFNDLHLEVVEIKNEITDKNLASSKRVELVSNAIQENSPAFVFSINFFPAIAEVCHIYKIPYLCWTVDSPVLELFSKSIKHNTNRIFLFDRAQYNYFHSYNPDCIFHLPLAAAVDRFDAVINNASGILSSRMHDISFVGSLYSEKNPLNNLSLSEYNKGYIDGLTEAALKVYGYNFIEDVITDDCVNELKKASSAFYSAEDSVTNPDHYVAAHSYIGINVAEAERIRTLNALAEHFDVGLYTRSDCSPLQRVNVHSGVKTLTEMPIIFNRSKINLNMTIKPIQTGLPLRIFDIMGCRGFCMTNYQEELTDLFEIGVDLEAYGSMEELIDKCAYYLEHDDIRARIALNGYEKVKESHTYSARLLEMIRKC